MQESPTHLRSRDYWRTGCVRYLGNTRNVTGTTSRSSAPPSTPPAQLTLADVNAWRAWLDANEHISNGVWLTLAKKGTTVPTSLTYAEALSEALCSGWIDGRKNAIDDATYRQHFTPRRARSMWSKRNVDLVGGLIAAGRMRERGLVEIALAKADGRWDRAYSGAARISRHVDRLAASATPEQAQ